MGNINRASAFEIIRTDSDLSTGARLLLLLVGDLVGDEQQLLTAGCDYLAGELHTSVSSVRRWRSELVDAGYLTPMFVGSGGDRANSYHLSVPLHRRTGTPPRPLHDPSTGGGKQEQEQEEQQQPKEKIVDQTLWDDAILIAEHAAGVRDVHAYAESILRRETEERIRDRARRLRAKSGAQHTSPPKLNPADCPHRNVTSDGDCVQCGTEGVR